MARQARKASYKHEKGSERKAQHNGETKAHSSINFHPPLPSGKAILPRKAKSSRAIDKVRVAQVSNLLYRRLPVGQVLKMWRGFAISKALQVGNLRYTRSCTLSGLLKLLQFSTSQPELFLRKFYQNLLRVMRVLIMTATAGA